MGVVYEDLYDHEGYASGHSSSDGTRRIGGRQTVDAYEAACSCGWNGTHDYPLTEEGRELAIVEWENEHALPLLEFAVPASVATAVEEAERAIRNLAGRRPQAARHLLERHGQWLKVVENGLAAEEAARRLGAAGIRGPAGRAR